MPTGPRAAVAAPLYTRTNAGSLLTSASVLRGDAAGRFYGGIEYRPELDNLGKTWEPSQSSPSTKDIGTEAAAVQFDPFAIYTASESSSLDSDYEYEAGRAVRALRVQESYLIESAFWGNTVDGSDFGASHPNVALADASAANLSQPNGITSVGIVTGLHDMIEALNDALGGARGMIHTDQRLVPFLTFYGLVTRNGNILQVTGTDHILVAGTGYTGSDPNGNSAAGEVWLYGTPTVEVRISQEVITPGTAAEALSRDVGTNTIRVYAEELVCVSFDHTVAHIGIPVCIPDPGPDCSGVVT